MEEKITFMKMALAETREIETPPSPIVPFADWDYYYLLRPIDWRSDKDSSKIINVPLGFVTDLASIPKVFYTLLSPAERYTYPAIMHDYMYWFQTPPFNDRAVADAIFREAMEELHVAPAKVLAVYEAVHLGGGHAWRSNAAARNAGERRVLKRFPTKVEITWDEWRQEPDVFA